MEDKTDIEQIEIDLLLDAVERRHGYDFREYSRASLTRRLRRLRVDMKKEHISDLIPLVLYGQGVMESLVDGISVTVSEMFRDPYVFKMVREKIVPYLKTYPKVNIWVAGCATGEEVYSLAILFKEEEIYDRVQIYATDINEKSLKKAKAGIYSEDQTKTNTNNYYKSMGRESFNDYYFTKFHKVMMDRDLMKNVVFLTHNLAVDRVFNEMQMIFCRNVLIYFSIPLQERVLKLFDDSLCKNGFLALGTKEHIRFSKTEKSFRTVGKKEKIFQKIMPRAGA
ncbi:MAG: protein-glutamate O-methyltransferase CheR [Desulfobulbaceae bacterium]|nr:protein-glutamate O-methyltransferase CheR [Desulfobulbaceae bacterium]